LADVRLISRFLNHGY